MKFASFVVGAVAGLLLAIAGTAQADHEDGYGDTPAGSVRVDLP